MDVPASEYIYAIFLSVGSGTKHGIFFSRLGRFPLSLVSTVSWTHLSSLPHTLPLIIISPLCSFVTGVVYESPGHYSVTTLTLYVRTGKCCPPSAMSC
jgi:hypothetical protein